MGGFVAASSETGFRSPHLEESSAWALALPSENVGAWPLRASEGRQVSVFQTRRVLRSGCGMPGARALWAPSRGQTVEAQTPRQFSPSALCGSLFCLGKTSPESRPRLGSSYVWKN